MGDEDRKVQSDKLILADAYFKMQDKVNRMSYSETCVTFDGEHYIVDGIDKNRSEDRFEPFIFKIPKSRVLKDKTSKELDNYKLYFVIFNREDETTFLLWLTLEEWGAENIPRSMYE
jgi:hypothetical protein